MKKGTSYLFSEIETFAERNKFTLSEVGEDYIGQGFVVLKHNNLDCVVSFALTGVGLEYIYTCVYSDLDTWKNIVWDNKFGSVK